MSRASDIADAIVAALDALTPARFAPSPTGDDQRDKTKESMKIIVQEILPDTLVTLKRNGLEIGRRPTINFIEGTNISMIVADDVSDDEIDVTISSDAASNVAASDVSTVDEFANSNSTNVQDVLDDLDAAISGSGSVAASDVSTIDEFTYSNANNVQDVLDDLDNAITGNMDHISFFQNGSSAGDASRINFVDGASTSVSLVDNGTYGDTMDVEINAYTLDGASAGGDLGGTYPNPTVTDLSIGAPSSGDIIYYDGTKWALIDPSNSFVEEGQLAGGDLSGNYPDPVVRDLSIPAKTGDMLYCSDEATETWSKLANPGNDGGDPWILNHDGTNPQWVHISTVQ